MKLAEALLVVGLMLSSTQKAAAERFSFAALGDMPYGDPAVSHPRLEALIGVINAHKPSFVLHVGDIKASSDPCTDSLFETQLRFMGQFEGPLVYTPGDNEWTDCYLEKAGGFDPLERLKMLRRMFFVGPQSLGRQPIALERQGDLMTEHAGFVENARFSKGGISVVTLHVVGSNNALEPRAREGAAEFFDRDRANLAWLRDSFAKARREGAKAVVIAMQADMFEFDFGHFGKDTHLSHSGFRNVSDALVEEANAFGRPVLLLYGDSHKFLVSAPYRKRAPALLALQVFGAEQMHAVEVQVDTEDAAVFSFRPIWNSDR